jgi:hypothetical protein
VHHTRRGGCTHFDPGLTSPVRTGVAGWRLVHAALSSTSSSKALQLRGWVDPGTPTLALHDTFSVRSRSSVMTGGASAAGAALCPADSAAAPAAAGLGGCAACCAACCAARRAAASRFSRPSSACAAGDTQLARSHAATCHYHAATTMRCLITLTDAPKQPASGTVHRSLAQHVP